MATGIDRTASFVCCPPAREGTIVNVHRYVSIIFFLGRLFLVGVCVHACVSVPAIEYKSCQLCSLINSIHV